MECSSITFIVNYGKSRRWSSKNISYGVTIGDEMDVVINRLLEIPSRNQPSNKLVGLLKDKTSCIVYSEAMAMKYIFRSQTLSLRDFNS